MNIVDQALDIAWLCNFPEHGRPHSIPAAFAAAAAAHPDAEAVEPGTLEADRAGALTFRDLDAAATGLARALLAAGVGPGDIVGVQTARSPDLVVALLGILKAGAAYLPLDAGLPAERLAFMVADSGARVAVVSPGATAPVPGLATVAVGATGPETALPEPGPEDPAYVIYTSGSTGRPKGVVTPHRAVLRLVCGADYADLGPGTRILQMAPVAFDAATFEIWGAVLNGGTCVIHPGEGIPDFARLGEILRASRIDTMWLTSALFNAVVDRDPLILAPLRSLLIGGEALSPAHVRRAQAALGCAIVNGYGPTETTTFACTYPIPHPLPAEWTAVPIGRPIAGTAVAILDVDGAHVAPGEPGELCIAGPGLALGYLNRPDLTAERFVESGLAPGGRYYRTGDIVRMRGDGAIDYIGRADGQVKIAGHRIELGEVEAALKAQPGVRDAAVIVDGTGEVRRLAAFVTGGEDLPPEPALRRALAQSLPDYMVPAAFERRDALPITANGKLDRAALKLSRRARPALEKPYAPPRGPREAWIAATWETLLGVAGIGRHDRFFELGGTSLSAMRFLDICRSERAFELRVAEFFDNPTLEGIAAAWDRRERETVVRRAPVAPPAAAGDMAIAIVGIAARTAGAETAAELWEMLLEGRTGRVRVTAPEIAAEGEDPGLLDDPDFVPFAFPLKDWQGFDAGFFGFTPREVELMDPQQRLMLEAAWNALEDAGHDPRQGTDRIGVFGGVGRNAYMLHNLMTHPAIRAAAHEYSMLIGNERDFPCTHIAYRFGLSGPAVSVQTACSTSGVAIHMAAESLRRGECDMALAGGAKFLVPHRAGYMYTEGGPLSPDGEIRAFDADARGMVRGSGVAMLALKRLDDALEAGDHIYALLKGSAVNNDGAAKAGFTAPSMSGQAEVIAEAQARARISAESVGYIEAHGTGTLLGDPIEIEGLTRAFRASTDRTGFCAIGSIKTNIGHLDAGATAAGVIKAALALKHEVIPPSINFATPNPRIPFDASPFRVATERMPWPRGETPRRAGVSSFGLGGTNAHLIIEEAPQVASSDPAEGPQLLVLSARTEGALARRADDLAGWLERHPEANLADVAHTLASGRRRFEKRLALVARDIPEAVAKLRARGPRDLLHSALAGEETGLAFLFPGNGAQHAGMALGAHAALPVFRAEFDRLDTLFAERHGGSLMAAIRAGDAALSQAALAQPALFAVEYALARQWLAWGARPEAMIGHSLGEYAAACLAGVFSPEDALAIVAARGRLVGSLPEGAMLSVPMAEDALRERLPAALDIAAVNAPGQCVVSGPVAAVTEFEARLGGDGIETRRLAVTVAYHSAMIDGILGDFAEVLNGIDLAAPEAPYISTLTGTWAGAEVATPDYWLRHLREPVRFGDGAATLLGHGALALVEMGPGRVLGGLARQAAGFDPARHEAIQTLAPADGADAEAIAAALGRVWLTGARLDWARVNPGRRHKLPLPAYPFERSRHWVDAVAYADAEAAPAPAEGPEAAPEAPAAAAQPADRRGRLLLEMQRILSGLSGLPEAALDPHTTFLQLGFDSLFLTQANAAFRKAFRVKLSTRQLIDEVPTLDQLATHVDALLPEGAETGAPEAAPPAASTATAAAATSGKTAAAPNVAPPTVSADTARGGLTPLQERHIDALIAETVRRTPKAKAATQASRRVLADPRTVQGFRQRWKEMVYPVLSDRAKGARVWDVDGNEYIDLVGGYGVTFLGHQPDFVVEAIRAQTDRTLAIGPQSVLAGEVAQMVCDFTGMERVAFCNTGSEAVLAAVRMARTVTGKSKIAKFDGHYHGIFDEMQVRGAGQGSRLRTLPAAPGIPQEAVQNTLILDYGDPDAFDVIREQADEIALVLVEPVRSRNPDFQPIEYVQALRRLTEELGIPLMFDEIVTGFRCHPQGAQHLFGIRADIATYGKVAGGGLPIGIVAGRAQYLDTLDGGFWNYGDDSQPTADMTWFAGTFVRHPMALAATKAVLGHLKAEGPALQEGLNAKAARLTDELNAFFASVSAPLRMERFSSVLRLTFTARVEYADLLFFHLRNRGIMTYEGRPIFLSTAHTEADLDAVRDAFRDSVSALIEVGLMPGTRPDGSRVIAMAPGQQEIWVSSQFSDGASCSYNLCSTIELEGPLDRAVLQGALADLVARHEALRSVPDASGETQTIRARIDVGLPVTDLAGLAPAARDAARAAAERAEVTTPFDLVNGPLVRAHLLALGPDRHKLLLTVHHVIADGYSCGVLVRELGRLYAARRDGTEAGLPPAQQLSDYVGFLAQPDMAAARDEARAYWLDLYRDGLPRIDLPSDRPRPTQRDYRAVRFVRPMDPGLVAALRGVARSQDATLFAALLAGFSAYLSRLTGEEVTPLGFSAAGQPLMGGSALVGHCVNFLPLRIASRLDLPFEAHVRASGGAVLDALEHQNFDFVSFVKEMKTERDVDWAPLVSIGINLDAAAKEIEFADFRVTADSVGRAFEHLDLFLNFVQTADGAELQCTFNAARHDEATMRRRMEEYLRFLAEAAAAPGTALGQIAFTDPAEAARLRTEQAGRATDYPRDAAIAELFRETALRHAGATALVAPDLSALTYADLDRRSDAWAARLAAQGIGAGDRIALFLPRSVDLIVAILATLKAGAVYVPLDADLPAARVEFILRDCGARLVLTTAGGAGALPAGAPRVEMDTVRPGPAAPAPARSDAGDAACIMYTSGSTGTPKGVLVPHRAIVRLVRGTDYARFDAGRVFLQLAPVGFDAASFEIWGALLNGGTLVLAAPGLATDPAGLRRTLREQGVTTLWLTAGLFNALVDHDPTVLEGVEEVLTGGEALSLPHVRRALAALPEVRLINGYGPTENATFTCTHPIPRDLPADLASVPIGRPIRNTRAYVVDRGLAPVPEGVAGELVVAGDGLALGYLGQPEATAAAFVAAPALGEARVYRTGDYVRWRADGTLEFLGRRDAQVKIRGFRIEPGEIAATLSGLPGVEAAAVIHLPDQGGTLAGFCTVTDPGNTAAALSEALRARLPRHMVPARIEVVEALPVTANGKLDTAALRARAQAAQAAPPGPVRALTSIEVALTGLWRELLGIEAIRPEDSFFELGGHSLLAVELFARIEGQFGTLMPISTLFAAPTIEALARKVEAAQIASSAGSDPEAEWDTSVVMHPGPAGSTAPPLFIVGGVGGNLNNLVELARLIGRQRRMIGFQTRGVVGHRPRGSIEEMAAEHLRYLRRHQPEGPVHLAGFSGGALVAFEMARQIEAAGGRVAALVLLDTLAPGFAPEVLHRGKGGFDPFSAGGRARLRAVLRDVALMGPAGVLARRRARGAGTEAAPLDEVGVLPDRFAHVAEAWFAAARRYRGGPFGGRTCLVLSTQEDDRYRLLLDRHPLAGWDRFIPRDRLSRVRIGATHRALVEMPHVAETARIVEEQLGRPA